METGNIDRRQQGKPLKMKLIQKRFHPCGGFYLRGVLNWLVPCNLLMLVVGAAMLSFDIYKNWNKLILEHQKYPIDFILRLGIWIVFVIHLCIGFPMDTLLYRATKNRNILKLKIWSVVNFFNTLLALSGYVARISHFGIHLPVLITPYLFYCTFRFYMCVVIYCYGIEAEEEEEVRANARLLTEAELREFEFGTEAERILEMETKNLIEKVQYLRYKREEFEIDMEKLEIDTESPLGSGSYGVVYRATYNRSEGRKELVAVKTFEHGIMDAQCFKALLAELKVMTYLGHHENVLNLIGAVTVQIKMRSLHMILEFCPMGCLLDYLKASRALFSNFVRNTDGEIVPKKDNLDGLSSVENELTTFHLIRWASEIASGMEYLEYMKVVHGDLAARNLLLTESRQIKIADFGLARQLYQYSVYVKKQNAPLPWRWLALESITDMNFSSKSDVWAFGIVMHELFTLGGTPYDDFKQFNLDFVEHIRNGLRLERSSFCPAVIYHHMKQCWDEDPSQRPSFHELHKILFSLTNDPMEVSAREETEACMGSSLTAPVVKQNDYISIKMEVTDVQQC